LARRNPVNPEGRPKTRSALSNPGETRSINYSERETRRDGLRERRGEMALMDKIKDSGRR